MRSKEEMKKIRQQAAADLKKDFSQGKNQQKRIRLRLMVVVDLGDNDKWHVVKGVRV